MTTADEKNYFENIIKFYCILVVKYIIFNYYVLKFGRMTTAKTYYLKKYFAGERMTESITVIWT